MLRTIPFTIILGAIMLFANTAEAASLFFTPGIGEFGLNKEIIVDLKIDSEGVGINAGQATIRFPKDILSVKSIGKADSTFNFWLEEPTFSNENGVISFVGGTPYGISGASIQVLRIVFTTKSSGTAPISIVDAAVTSSDGSGANVLSKTNDASFTVSPTKVTVAVVVPPTQIVREIVPASGLPAKPILSVPLYPDPALWYSHSDIFTVSWELPRDISGVATALNKQPNYEPTKNEGLFDSKMFDAPQDGIWYLHVQFKNNIGWGVPIHYRIAVDTKAPVPFEVTSSESEVSDNPTPTFNFKTNDALSDLREYGVRVDTEDLIRVPAKGFKGSYKLTNQNPGKHHLVIQAIDNAGNSIENSLDYEILPLVAPTFTFATERLFSDEAMGLSFKGTAIPSTEILFALKKGDSNIANEIVKVDTSGNWEFTFNESLRNGTYTASIQNRDARGALSAVVDAGEIQVTGRYTNILIILFTILVVSLIGGYFFYKKRRERTALRIEVAESDASKVFDMIEADVEKLKKAKATPTTVDDEFIIQKMSANIKKMGGYVKDTIKRAKE